MLEKKEEKKDRKHKKVDRKKIPEIHHESRKSKKKTKIPVVALNDSDEESTSGLSKRRSQLTSDVEESLPANTDDELKVDFNIHF